MSASQVPARVVQHAAAFNDAVRSGDWATFARRFTADATMEFPGLPVGPFTGRNEIARGYAAQPPEDTLAVTAVESAADEDVVRFAWTGGGAGTMCLTWAGPLISRLAVSFGDEPPERAS